MGYRMIVAGGRNFNDKKLFTETMNKMLEKYNEPEIVSGHASGADSMAEEFALEHGLSLNVKAAEWKKYGRAAGPIRNKEMLDYIVEEQPVLVAFWNGSSKGTLDMINRAKKANVDVNVVMYTE